MRKIKKRRLKNKSVGLRSISIVFPKVVGEPSPINLHYSRSKITEFAQNNRRYLTPAEIRLKNILNELNGGVLRRRFKLQHIVSGKWIVDFFFPEVRLAIEVDGGYHQTEEQKSKDHKKERDCKRFDITLMRLRNDEIFGDRDSLISLLRKGWVAAKAQEKKIIGKPYNNSR